MKQEFKFMQTSLFFVILSWDWGKRLVSKNKEDTLNNVQKKLSREICKLGMCVTVQLFSVKILEFYNVDMLLKLGLFLLN